jgi:outer membrane protein insertion porin family
VNISTAPGPEPDQVEVIVDVVEKSTGEFSVGAGYTTGTSTATQGVNIELSITERNFLGRGQYIRASAGGGLNARDFTFSFTEPYFLGRRLAAGFDIYRSSRDYSNYNSVVNGATLRLGLPISENLDALLAYNFSKSTYDYDSGVAGSCPGVSPVPCPVSQAIQQSVAVSPWSKSSVSGTLTYSTIDDKKNPHEGIFATTQLEYAGLGGDARFVKATGRGSYYVTLSEQQDIVGVLSGGGGVVRSTDGSNGLTAFDLFQNSTSIIRGFESNGIGPYDPVNDEHLGGMTYLNATAEAQFPLPAIPSNFGIKGAVFADTATLYGNDLQSGLVGTDMQWRASVGAGIIWASPFGPLRVNYAYPIVKEPTDKVQEFSFGVSTRF